MPLYIKVSNFAGTFMCHANGFEKFIKNNTDYKIYKTEIYEKADILLARYDPTQLRFLNGLGQYFNCLTVLLLTPTQYKNHIPQNLLTSENFLAYCLIDEDDNVLFEHYAMDNLLDRIKMKQYEKKIDLN